MIRIIIAGMLPLPQLLSRASISWSLVVHWWIRRLSSEGSWVRIQLWPPRKDLGQIIHSQLPVALRRENPTGYPCCLGSASE